MYKLVNIEPGVQVISRENADGSVSFIPNDEANRDWQDYQAWLAAGNEPLAADE